LWAGHKAYSDLMRELWGSPVLWNVKKTYVDIARKLGVDEETVRNRIKYLKESGFLLGWRLTPNPVLFGRKSSFLFLEFETEEDKEESIPRLAKMDGVVVIASIYGTSLLVTLFDDDEMNSAKEITTKMGIKTESFTTPGMILPRPISPKVAATDWQIIGLLLRDAETKVQEVAKQVKLSTKSVNRRLNELMTSRAVFIMPLVNLTKAGGIPYHLLVETEEEKRSEVDQSVNSRIENLVFKASASKKDLIFGFNGTNVAEGNEILKWVKTLPGVKSARMNIVERVVHVFDWLEKEVDKHTKAVASEEEENEISEVTAIL
jgi:DNA-binding Lrp family transcriptional regulator